MDPYPFLASGGGQQSLAFLGLQTHHSNPSLPSLSPGVSSDCACLFSYKDASHWMRAHIICYNLILMIYIKKSLMQTRLYFEVLGRVDL